MANLLVLQTIELDHIITRVISGPWMVFSNMKKPDLKAVFLRAPGVGIEQMQIYAGPPVRADDVMFLFYLTNGVLPLKVDLTGNAYYNADGVLVRNNLTPLQSE